MRIATACLLTLISSTANAQDWSGSMGLGAVYAPKYMGSDESAVSIVPDVRINYKNQVFASVADGVGYNAINQNGWRAGPVAKVRFSRDEDGGSSPFQLGSDTDDLRGMGDVDTAGEIGAFVEYTWQNIRSKLELRQGFGGHEGMVGDAKIDYVGQAGSTRYSFGPRVSFASADFHETYFSINAGQSARTGLAQYNADGGLTSYGVGASVMTPIDEKIFLSGFAGYDRLASEVADSPLVEDRGSANQFVVGAAVGYKFGW